METEIQKKISTRILEQRPKMSHPVKAVLGCMAGNWVPNARITQREIATTEQWLGSHPEHEQHPPSKQTTLRYVRQCIRDLRVKHGIPVLSSPAGYWLPVEEAEAQDFVVRMERQARARAAASIETYKAIRDSLELGQSELFEAMAKHA